MKEVISEMVKQIQNLSSEKSSGSIELQLIGGYTDEYYYSDHIFCEAMRILQSHHTEINLKLACIGEFNTIVRNGVPWPIIYGAGVDLKTGWYQISNPSVLSCSNVKKYLISSLQIYKENIITES